MSIPTEIQRQLDVTNGGDVEAHLDLFDESLVWHGSYDQNKDEIAYVFRSLYAAFPDLKYNWSEVWGDEARWGATQQITATHTGVFKMNIGGHEIELAPTGKAISLSPAKYEVRAQNGRIVEVTDGSKGQTFAELLQQLGITLPTS